MSQLDHGLICASCGYEDEGPHDTAPPCPHCGSEATGVRWMLGNGLLAMRRTIDAERRGRRIDYHRAAIASHKASEARRKLPAGSSRAKVTTANARWSSAAEERDRLGRLLLPCDRAAVDDLLAAQVGS